MPTAGRREVLCHLALIGQIPNWPGGTSERSVWAREMAQGQTIQHSNTKHETTHYRERRQPSDLCPVCAGVAEGYKIPQRSAWLNTQLQVKVTRCHRTQGVRWRLTQKQL